MDQILARLKEAKQKIIDLEEEKLKLVQTERELGERLEEDQVTYQAMVSRTES